MLKTVLKPVVAGLQIGLEKILKRRGRGMGQLRALMRGPYPITLVRARTRDGLQFALDPENFMDWIIIKNGYYEREVLDEIIRHLPDRGVLWDVGGNIGQHALTTKHLRPDVKVYAFEPVPFTAARMMLNAEINGIKIDIISIALGEKQEYGNISVSIRGNSGLSSLKPWANVTYDGSLICRVERGDMCVSANAAQFPSVIKLDVEGFELAVIEGLGAMVRDDRLKAIIFESDGDSLEQITSILVASGFRVLPIRQRNVSESDHLTPNYIASR